MGAAAAIPAIGAAAGALLNKDNRMQGALMGGLGGMALGPSMAGLLGGSGAVGSQSAMLAAQEAGLGATGGLGWGGATTGLQGAMNGAGGLLGKIGMSPAQAMMQGGKMMAGGQGQQPMQAPVQQAIPQRAQYPQTEAMTALQQQRQMYQPRSTRLY